MARTVWITGASSGIGRALAMMFTGHGDAVALSARSPEKLEEARLACVRAGGRCSSFAADVRESSQVLRAQREITQTLGPIDILINNAGVTSFKEFLTTGEEEFDAIIDTNLRGVYLTTKAVLPGMVERRSGLILSILSYAGKAVYTGSSAYAASKAGAEAMLNVIRAETRHSGVKIVNVYPGAVLTPIWHPKHQQRYGELMMRPEELAQVIYEVSCQPASMIIEDIIIRPQAGDLKV